MNCIYCSKPIVDAALCLDREKKIFVHEFKINNSISCSTLLKERMGLAAFLKYPDRYFMMDVYESIPELKRGFNGKGSVGRPSLGKPRKITITLPENEWKNISEVIEHGHAASYSDYFRQLHESKG
jgi:hypothetical protein